MASYNELLALIDAYINQNGVQAITGQVLNGVLRAMVDQLGRGYTIMGTAVPSTDPGTPDGPESWFASTPGTYTDMGGLTVANAELALLSYTPSDGWAKTTLTQGIIDATASVDNTVGTPSVQASYQNGILTFEFSALKGNTGDPAGFGAITASVDDQIGTPSVAVQTSGPDTAKAIAFQFHNLKGQTGVTSVVATVDNTTGNPTCTVSLVGQELHLDFTGLKGVQGDTGVSADYPITIANNLTTNDPTAALSAAMGVQLESEISQLDLKVDGLALGKFYGFFSDSSNLPEGDNPGYAYVGEESPFEIYNFTNGEWVDSGATTIQQDIYFTPEMYGAKGDGITDDTSAIISAMDAALTAGVPIKLSNKTYRYVAESAPEEGVYCSNIYGEGEFSVLLLDGFRLQKVFLTDSLESVDMKDFSVKKVNSYIADDTDFNLYNYTYHQYAVFYGNGDGERKTTSYQNIKFLADVESLDGTERESLAISEMQPEKGTFRNLYFENYACCLSLGDDRQNHCYDTEIDHIYGKNVELLVGIPWGKNYSVTNAEIHNTWAQKFVWMGKNSSVHPNMAGLDVVRCGGVGYVLNNIVGENVVERVIYSLGSNVTASKLTAIDSDGFKFVGRTASELSHNIYCSDFNFIVTHTYSELSDNGGGMFIPLTFYWVDEIFVGNGSYTNTTSNRGTTCVSYGISLARYVKDIVIQNLSFDYCSYEFMHLDVTSNGLADNNYIQVENCVIRDCYIKAEKGSTTTNTILQVRAEADAGTTNLHRIAFKNFKIFNNYVEYYSVPDQFLYNAIYMDGFLAYGNRSSIATTLLFPTTTKTIEEGDVFYSKNVVIKEKDLLAPNTLIYTSDFASLFSNAYFKVGSEFCYTWSDTQTSTYSNRKYCFSLMGKPSDDYTAMSGHTTIEIYVEISKSNSSALYTPSAYLVEYHYNIDIVFFRVISGATTGLLGTSVPSKVSVGQDYIRFNNSGSSQQNTAIIRGFV